jgi:Ca-activated chloride channel family protein
MKITTWAGAMLAIMLSAVLSSAGDTGHITGRVLDAYTQTPVAGATVVVEGTQLSARTGSDGVYTIANVPAGVYIVRAGKAGMPSVLQRVSVTAGRTVTVDFTMTRGQDHPAKPENEARQHEGESADEGRTPQTRSMQMPSPGGIGKMSRTACESPFVAWQSPGFESYDNIDENGWLATLDKPLSTFSVDVDAASYGNVRRFITSGQLPPVDAVRIEELITPTRAASIRSPSPPRSPRARGTARTSWSTSVCRVSASRSRTCLRATSSS